MKVIGRSNSIGNGRGIGGALRHALQGENFIRHIGNDKVIFDFHEGSGTTVKDKSHCGNDGAFPSGIPIYASQYPTQDDDHVKSTTKFNTNYWAYFATDPTKSLIGTYDYTSWLSVSGTNTNQRFHIDLGSAKVIKRIYYENIHTTGGQTNIGVKNFTFWGSNIASGSFDDLVYGNDEGWTQLDTSPVSTFDEHVGADQADPKYIVVDNAVSYRYYAFKFADNHGDATYIGVRRIELQTINFAKNPTWKRNSLYFDGGDIVVLTGIVHGITTGGFTICFNSDGILNAKYLFSQKTVRLSILTNGEKLSFFNASHKYITDDTFTSISRLIVQVTRDESGNLEGYVNGKAHNQGTSDSVDLTYDGTSIVNLGSYESLLDTYGVTTTMYSFRILNKGLSGIECQQEYLAEKFSNN